MGVILTDYIMYLDESGSHYLNKIDPNFPVLCLSGCIFNKEYYHTQVRQRIDNLKIKYWNNTEVIFHSREIRKHEGVYKILGDKNVRDSFYNDLNYLVSTMDFTIIAAVIDIPEHKHKYNQRAYDPYYLSFKFILERFPMFLRKRSALGYAIAESRGKTEDKKIKGWYKQLSQYGTEYLERIDNITSFTTKNKSENIDGMQLSDLVAYPVATKYFKPNVINPAFEIIKTKFLTGPKNQILGYGYKIFPPTEKCNSIFN